MFVCQQFKAQFHAEADHASCMAKKSLKVWSTSAVTAFMTSSCSPGHAMKGCELCNSTACPTSDPLLAYTTACTDMIMSGCQPWQALCEQETPAAAQVLCLDRREWVTSGSSNPPPFSTDACITNSTAPECAGYTYPDSAALADIAKLCGSMPDMPGCSIAAACEKGEHVAAKYCRPFTLLATLCADMPGMKGCENYKALCKKEGSVVGQCAKQPAIPGAPTWSSARTAVFDACDDHPMSGCASCSKSDCPDPLASLASICHEMPSMAVCSNFWAFCNIAGTQDMAPWCAQDDAKYLPSMLMYFHQRTQELLLWKEWRPMTSGQYAGSVIAILAMGIVSTGLKTVKGALALHWAHERTLAGGPPPVTNVFLPQQGQLLEVGVKCLITGVSLTLDYFNMLIAMTFNIGFFCAVIAGYILGTLLFGHVLDNYSTLLHQRRRVLMAPQRRKAGGAANGLASGGAKSGYVPPTVPGEVDLEAGARVLDSGEGSGLTQEGRSAARLAGGGDTAERLTSDEESEDTYRVVVASEGDCNCVHSA